MIQWLVDLLSSVTDSLWPEYCACGERMLGGVCPLGAGIGDDCEEAMGRPEERGHDLH